MQAQQAAAAQQAQIDAQVQAALAAQAAQQAAAAAAPRQQPHRSTSPPSCRSSAALKEQGLIDDAEFSAMKAKVLGI